MWNMKKRVIKGISVALLCMMTMGTVTGCGEKATPAQEQPAAQVATADEMAEPVNVVEEGMVPIYADALVDGTYNVVVDSSSPMFQIVDCALTVTEGQMEATMTMGGTGYLYVYMGTGEEAAAADEATYIPFDEGADGVHTFTVPVTALDAAIDCSAFSKRKEKWYDRTLLFRSDSLPNEAFVESRMTAPESLQLADGTYTVAVTLEGGSGKTTVESPAELIVADGQYTVKLVLSSSKYDYMKVAGEQYLPVNTEGNSTFIIPVLGFDYKMPVLADTTAMSTPHEIAYTIYLDAATIQEVQP
jgi:hypothetical protein